MARPGRIVSAPTTAVIASSTIWVDPRPSTSGPSSQIDATAMAGIVSPMLAIAEPSARLRLTWMRSRRALLTAVTASGSSTTRAITTPTADGGAPMAAMASSMAGDSSLASPTTATSATSSRPTLVSVSRLVGGGPWSSSPSATSSTGM